MDLRALAQQLGGDVAGRDQILCPGPGHSLKDRSLSVRIASSATDGFTVYSHAGDDFGDCRDHVRDRLGLVGRNSYHGKHDARSEDLRSTQSKERVEASLNDQQTETIAGNIWRSSLEPRGTVVEAYLESRHLALGEGMCGTVLRYHPGLLFDGQRVPAMVALYRDIHTDQPCGVHRTFLDLEGRKLGRRMLGRAKDAAIKLDADPEVSLGLTIAEGIESALSGRMAGFAPTWALGSCGAITNFPVLNGIEALTILAETDDSGANAMAVRQCARRWLEADREVMVVEPKVAGDLNDVLRRAAA
ncbi:DUF7146 domain-containing protein [Jiella marina]|uniref:DUF7146 domain-containing protein n=1 Tax=Jiella sp. LLJ827 TaxID=2917712 RepID=UPI002101C091|nr:toprim domain-containing protein [Jiella sp. LLJ827]MCQ0986489.1 toprim domain-containing protein [Jiella sp. LLJ827]